MDEIRDRQDRLGKKIKRGNGESLTRIHATTRIANETHICLNINKERVISMARTPKEKAIDSFLTAFLVSDAYSRDKTNFISETKLQKLVFLSEKAMIDEREKGFNYYFIKYKHGPFSFGLQDNTHQILDMNLVNDFGLRPTETLELILNTFRELIEKNNSYIQKIKSVNDEYAGKALEELLDLIYDMPWGARQTIRDLPRRKPMLYPMKPNIVRNEFQATDEEVENLIMNFDLEIVSDLDRAMQEMRMGRSKIYETVFPNL